MQDDSFIDMTTRHWIVMGLIIVSFILMIIFIPKDHDTPVTRITDFLKNSYTITTVDETFDEGSFDSRIVMTSKKKVKGTEVTMTVLIEQNIINDVFDIKKITIRNSMETLDLTNDVLLKEPDYILLLNTVKGTYHKVLSEESNNINRVKNLI